ncbi:F-box/LRR-repeat protein At3g58930-like [Papaver somniferum]|uniref:F-box/LRR-repeat protein At3g58930-like n=1 Tax=Papaver somniferum TaxID=3469 RepID=UPI000E701E15|nr:F-box/LRR-repeat protein At3g58930-like [Papaver somniferum]
MEESRNAPGEDRISRLPDGLIHHILSFNDTKYVVQTSVLSKRWIHIWKSLPVLEFNRSLFSHENTKKFIEFVYMVFMFRDDTDLQKFSLDWDSEYDNTVIMNVNRWSLFAVKYNVQEISIVIEELLLNSRTLIKLEIQVFDTDEYVDIILPRSMNSPRLKELFIYRSSVSNLELSKRFFSSCPVLEKLFISGCDYLRNLNLIVDSQSLTKVHLKIYSPPSWISFNMILREKEEDENAKTYSKLPSKEIDVYAKRLTNLLDAGDDWEVGLSFPGMLSHLEHFEFIYAEGSDAEFKILSFLLQNEMVLKKIGVTFRSSVAQRDRKRHVKRFSDKIRAGRKASSSIQLAYNLKLSW